MIIGALPFVVITLVSIVSPDYMKPLWNDYRGNVALSIAGGMMSFGMWVMNKMTKFEYLSMYAGQPLTMKEILPAWMTPQDLYIRLASVVMLGCLLGVAYSFRPKNNTVSRIRAIQERRQDMFIDATGARKRKRRPETSVNFMRAVVTRLQLMKNSEIGKREVLLMEAGFRSKDAIFVMTFFNLLLPIVFCVIGLIAMRLNSHVSHRWQMLNYVWPVLGAYLGLNMSKIYVLRARRKRYIYIQRALSDVLDLMTICAEWTG